ncbi:MAG: undecaprenyl-diphosphate phosphatase [Pseudomonadota bacterium]
MDNLQIVLLAIVQGLTEFLPISSSAHLILLPRLLMWPDQGLVFDVAVHIGSLIAVVFYFRSEIRRMTVSWVSSITGSAPANQDSLLAWWVVVATLPAILVGFLAQSLIEAHLRSALVIALASIVFGLLLLIVDVRAKRNRDEYQLRLKDVLLIGCFQVLALIPGTSRSGITITCGLMLGLTREAAARFSFLLAIPVIIASGALQSFRMVTEVNPISWVDLLMGVVLSAVSAGLCIHYFLRLVEKIGMLPFVVYRVVLGLLILWLVV